MGYSPRQCGQEDEGEVTVTQDEAALVLRDQRYTIRHNGEVLTFVGLDALVAKARTDSGVAADDPRIMLLPLAEYIRLGALPMPEVAGLREEVERVIEWTTQAVTAAETLRRAPADYMRDVEDAVRSSKGVSK